jgi:hypothetical protein
MSTVKICNRLTQSIPLNLMEETDEGTKEKLVVLGPKEALDWDESMIGKDMDGKVAHGYIRLMPVADKPKTVEVRSRSSKED